MQLGLRDIPLVTSHLACVVLGLILQKPFAQKEVKLNFSSSHIYFPVERKYLSSSTVNKSMLGDSLVWIRRNKKIKSRTCHLGLSKSTLVLLSSFVVILIPKKELKRTIYYQDKFSKHIELVKSEKAEAIPSCKVKPSIFYGS